MLRFSQTNASLFQRRAANQVGRLPEAAVAHRTAPAVRFYVGRRPSAPARAATSAGGMTGMGGGCSKRERLSSDEVVLLPAVSAAAGDPMAAEMVGPAVDHLMAAARRAVGLDPARSLAHSRRALDLMSPEDPRRPRALVGAGSAALVAGRFDEADDDLRSAIDLFRKHDDEIGGALDQILGIWTLAFGQWAVLAELGMTAAAGAVLRFVERHDDEHYVPSAIQYLLDRPWRVLYAAGAPEDFRGHRLERVLRAR